MLLRPTTSADWGAVRHYGNSTATATAQKAKKSAGANRLTLAFLGSPTWARTRDLRINSPALYRLSYRGIEPGSIAIGLASEHHLKRRAPGSWLEWEQVHMPELIRRLAPGAFVGGVVQRQLPQRRGAADAPAQADAQI